MTLDQVENFINVEVSGTHTSGDTTVSLANGEASNLPDPANGDYNLVWYDSTNYSNPTFDPNVEIIRVTGRDTNNDTVTVSRGQENTTATSKNTSGATYRMALVPTAKTIEDIGAGGFLNTKDLGSVSTNQTLDPDQAQMFLMKLTASDVDISWQVKNKGQEVFIYLKKSVNNKYDLSTASQVQTTGSGDSFPTGVALNDDGGKMFVLRSNNREIAQYTLSTPYDISTASQDKTYGTLPQYSYGLSFNDDGTRMYYNSEGDGNIHQLDLGTAYDIGNVSNTTTVGANSGGNGGVQFFDNGNKFYECSTFNGVLIEYNAGTAYDITTLTKVQQVSITEVVNVAFNSDGSRMILARYNTDMDDYTLSTNYDISTRTQQGTQTQARPVGLETAENGTRMYTTDADNGNIYQYNLGNDSLNIPNSVGSADFLSGDTLPASPSNMAGAVIKLVCVGDKYIARYQELS